MATVLSFSQRMHRFWNGKEKMQTIMTIMHRLIYTEKSKIFMAIANYQYEKNLYLPLYENIDPKELFIFQCNGLELNRPEITILYLAIKDIANGNIEDGNGLRLYDKYLSGLYNDSEFFVENLKKLVGGFVNHDIHYDNYLICEKNMGILKGSSILACALFFGEKTIRVKKTITNWDQKPTWGKLITAGFSDDEIDYIRQESDILVQSIRKNKAKGIDLDQETLRKWVMKEYKKNRSYVGWRYYQSLPMLGINDIGARPTDIRIEQYGLKNLLNSKMDILDVGCNIGFLDMEISSLVRNVTGIEYDPELSQLSTRIAHKLNISNVTFVSADFKQWQSMSLRKYDFIMLFAVHRWIDLSPIKFAAKIASLIKPNGVIIFEGHDVCDLSLEKTNQEYDEYISAFLNNRFKIIKNGYSTDQESVKRIWTLLQQNGDL